MEKFDRAIQKIIEGIDDLINNGQVEIPSWGIGVLDGLKLSIQEFPEYPEVKKNLRIAKIDSILESIEKSSQHSIK